MIKPVLIPADKSSYSLIKDISDRVETTGKLHLPSPHGSKVKYYHTILIDTEAEIKEGDFMYCSMYPQDRSISDKSYKKELTHLHKIISTAEKNDSVFPHNLPQLSPNSIQLLINYYNEHKCMPESVEIETGGSMEEFQDYCGSLGLEWNNMVGWVGSVKTGWRPNTSELEEQFNKQIKLNQQGEVDITIPEVEFTPNEDGICSKCSLVQVCNQDLEPLCIKKKLYTEKEVEMLILDYADYVANKLIEQDENPGCEFLTARGWFNTKKK